MFLFSHSETQSSFQSKFGSALQLDGTLQGALKYQSWIGYYKKKFSPIQKYVQSQKYWETSSIGKSIEKESRLVVAYS